MKRYPAVDVRADSPDLILAFVDDFSPTAVEERDDTVRVFFSTPSMRNCAAGALAARGFDVRAIDVPDEDWARRSQESLEPVTIGRITITPDSPTHQLTNSPILIAIVPSMGFGTGHHATTRLCLEALQTIDLAGAMALDVGTGSGVLAIAAERLGAARAIGIDHDPDAIEAARENLTRNPEARHVEFLHADLLTVARVPSVRTYEARKARKVRKEEQSSRPLRPSRETGRSCDVVLANLTGALLVRSAARLLDVVRPGGLLVLSGLQPHERGDVAAAFAPSTILWEREEDGWIGLVFRA